MDEAFGHLETVIGAHVAVVQRLPPEAAALWGLPEDTSEDVIEH